MKYFLGALIAFCILSVQTKAEKNETIYYNVSKYGVKGNGNTLFPYTTLFRSESEERRVGKECKIGRAHV